MAKESFEVSTVLPTTPAKAYEAWLDSDSHAAFTGASAKIAPTVGGRFTAWGGYIEGETKELERGRRVVQTWRTSEFAASNEDSLIEVLFVAEGEGTRLVIRHSNIPEGQGRQYESGWRDHYFTPMLAWFKELKNKPAVRAASKAPVKKAAPAKHAPKKAAPKATARKKVSRPAVAAKKATPARKAKKVSKGRK